MSTNFSFFSHHNFSLVLQIETFSLLSIHSIPSSFTVNSKMDYREFIFIVLVCHSSLELRLVLFLHSNQFVRNDEGRNNRKKLRIFTQVSCSTVKYWKNDEKGMRIWILMERNYVENWKKSHSWNLICHHAWSCAIKGCVLSFVKLILSVIFKVSK